MILHPYLGRPFLESTISRIKKIFSWFLVKFSKNPQKSRYFKLEITSISLNPASIFEKVKK